MQSNRRRIGVAFVFEKVKLVSMPEVTEVIETVLYVRDVERAEGWYQRLFGFPVIFREGDRFRALKVGGVQVLLLFKEGSTKTARALPGGVIPPHDGVRSHASCIWHENRGRRSLGTTSNGK